jgi:hypothetical protein
MKQIEASVRRAMVNTTIYGIVAQASESVDPDIAR